MILPTEAQWEYAARAGKAGSYSGGTIDEVAWYRENCGIGHQHVGTKKPNSWGLHDMHGNVWEWCADWYSDKLDGGVDPSGSSWGTNRVFRGGHWNTPAINCRVAHRRQRSPDWGDEGLGFRVARSSVP
jgi:formylglycine-generating enzyme required for sulfatase activity